MSASPYTASCLCGGVQLALKAEPGPIQICHCVMCRKAQGGPFAAHAEMPASALDVTAGAELLANYESSPGVHRMVHAEPVRYRFDPTHTFAHFEVVHFNTSTIHGRFGPIQGDATLDRAARKGRVQVEIDTAQVSTGVPPLDARLKEGDMLSVGANPRAYLVAERVEFDDAGRVKSLRGEFTLRGVSMPLTLTALRFN